VSLRGRDGIRAKSKLLNLPQDTKGNGVALVN